MWAPKIATALLDKQLGSHQTDRVIEWPGAFSSTLYSYLWFILFCHYLEPHAGWKATCFFDFCEPYIYMQQSLFRPNGVPHTPGTGSLKPRFIVQPQDKSLFFRRAPWITFLLSLYFTWFFFSFSSFQLCSSHSKTAHCAQFCSSLLLVVSFLRSTHLQHFSINVCLYFFLTQHFLLKYFPAVLIPCSYSFFYQTSTSFW